MKNKLPIAFIRVFSIFAVIFILTALIVPSQGMSDPAVIALLFISLLVLIVIEKVKEATEKLYTDHVSEEEKQAYYAKKSKSEIKDWKSFMHSLTKAKAIQEENEIILDHDYDGIKELDNDLPPWWVYGFYATILFAFVYLGYYEVFDGESQTDEYNEQVYIAKQEIAAYKKTLKKVDLSSLASDAGALGEGKKIFKQNCAACHLVDGGGSIGPNLTDDHWILGGGIENVINTVSNGGRDGKGMIAWKNSLNADKIQKVASYVWSLQGTTPSKPKAAEGEIWVEK